MRELKTETDNNGGDFMKRLPSKRGLQEFLVFPKGNKVTIEVSHDEVSEPGSHKKIQTVDNGGESVTKLIDLKKTVPIRENV